MMLIAGQSNRIWHYWSGRYPGSVGVLIGPSYGKKVPIDPWMPFVLDNDAFTCWKHKRPWDVAAWRKMLQWVQLTRQKPLWAAVPDVVANRQATLDNWPIYAPEIERLGWTPAFVMQDGMSEEDIPSNAQVLFIGGSDNWKFPNLKRWCDFAMQTGRRVHCGRVTSLEMIEACERLGCESVDGTGWFRAPDRPDHLPALQRFIEGYRNPTPFLLTT